VKVQVPAASAVDVIQYWMLLCLQAANAGSIGGAFSRFLGGHRTLPKQGDIDSGVSISHLYVLFEIHNKLVSHGLFTPIHRPPLRRAKRDRLFMQRHELTFEPLQL